MRKKLSNKHDHKLTHFLKVFIYMCVMLAPFLAIASKVWYVSNNKNAKDSYSGSYRYIATLYLNELINRNSLTLNNYIVDNVTYSYIESENLKTTYKLEAFDSTISLNKYFLFNVDGFSYNNIEYPNTKSVLIRSYNGWQKNYFLELFDTLYKDTYGLDITYTGTIKYIINGNNYNPTNTFRIDATTNELTINSIENKMYTNTIDCTFYNYMYTNIFYSDTTLSSVFYSAIDELDKASIFSWTTNTELYQAINNMCMMLGISSPPLAVLLTYWMLITIIYVIIDIVIEMIIWLTHLANDQLL